MSRTAVEEGRSPPDDNNRQAAIRNRHTASALVPDNRESCLGRAGQWSVSVLRHRSITATFSLRPPPAAAAPRGKRDACSSRHAPHSNRRTLALGVGERSPAPDLKYFDSLL